AAIANGTLPVSDRSGATTYVPVHFHLVGDAAGNGKHKERFVLDQLCQLNESYAAMDVQFYLDAHPTYGLFDKSINNDGVYDDQTNSFIMQNRRNQNAVNIFVVNSIAASGSLGTVLGRYVPQNDWLLIIKSQTNGNGNGTLDHELGHFFTLMHTFLGYETNPFEPTDPTWPIAPVLSPGGYATERANGSNSNIAADELEDTPPDYNFGYIATSCNQYTGGAKDPLGATVDPMENNFMGYFIGCDDYAFTPMQMDVITADIQSPQRNYLDNTFTPVATEITTPTDLLVAPISGETTQFFDNVMLQWNTVPGATLYLVEVDITTNYGSPNAQTFITDQASVVVEGLQANRTYYWRVRPFNEYATCAIARQQTFKTPFTSNTNEVEGLSSWQVWPNPANDAQNVNVAIQADIDFDASINVFDAVGRRVQGLQGVRINSGLNNITLPIATLPNGLYFIVLDNGAGRSTKKLSIVK
ncbi:MAG: T9SS type A sorting domain-containing protein, partial [Saprospiraceae bacterium]|nr:T9SS type A sorting domain-containing protein [Saprospiraceae bacterium]